MKAGPLTEDERREMERHPVIGHEIVSGIRFISSAAEIVLCHQERYDGSGYPNGLSGSEIPPGARIVAVADIFEAMTHARPFRQALGYSAVVQELSRSGRRRFDPRVVEAFLRVPEADWEQIREQHGQDGSRNLFSVQRTLPAAGVQETALPPEAAGTG